MMGDDGMNTVKYALRHLPSGRFVRLETISNIGEDFCGEETCALVASDRDTDLPRFEVDTLYGLLAAMKTDVPWFNSSREHPMWGKLKPEDVALVAIETVREYDGLGGDPVSVHERTHALELPPKFTGEAIRTRQPKASELVELFGAAGDIDEDAWPFVAIVRPASGEAMDGLLFEESLVGRGVVVSSIPIPAKWPMERERPFDRADPSWCLALMSSETLRAEGLPLEFLAERPFSGEPSLRP